VIKRELRKTGDGSMTIYQPEIDEHYHSYHGALQEAVHVFIKNGIQKLPFKDEISVFELGFGTGLNALLTAIWSIKNNKKVSYFGLEAFPVEKEMNRAMNYSSLISESSAFSYFEKIIDAEWEKVIEVNPNFQLKKVAHKIQDVIILEQFDVVFFDAFGFRAQEEMWSYDVLEKTTQLLKTEGLFVTYCAKGQFKRNLNALGLRVEALPGPPGKREMTIAWKI